MERNKIIVDWYPDIEKTFDRLHTKEDIKQDVYLNLLTMTDDRFNDLLNKKKLLQYIGRTAKFMTWNNNYYESREDKKREVCSLIYYS